MIEDVTEFFLSCIPSKNLEMIIKILINDYSLDFIFKTISHRLKFLIKNQNHINKEKKKSYLIKRLWFIVPFVDNISDKF